MTKYDVIKNNLIIISKARIKVLEISDKFKWYDFIINRKGINKIDNTLEKYHQMYMIELSKLDKYL